MDNFEDWWDDEKAYGVSGGSYDLKQFVREAYKAGVKSQQNRIIELEEIISGREELQRGSI